MNDTKRTPAIECTTGDKSLTIGFSNGKQLFVQLGELNSSIIEQATLHGLKQKLVDAAAISRNPDTGRSATIDDKYAAVREVYDRLLAGNWNKGRVDGSGSGTGGLLYRALCLHYPAQTPEAIRAFLEKKSAAEKTALRNVPAIMTIIASLKADSEIDTDVLLGELREQTT